MPSPGSKTHGTDVMLLIGQLLSATQAASEGLKSTNTEIQANGKALIAAVKTLELIEETVAELDRLIRTGNGDSLITRFAVLKAEVADIQLQVTALETRVQVTGGQIQAIGAQMRDTDSTRRVVARGRQMAVEILKALGWIITTTIAVYAALRGTQ